VERIRTIYLSIMKRCFFLLSYGDLSIFYASPSVEQVLGSPPDFYINRTFLQFLHEEERLAAEIDFRGFMEAKTLYGSVTKCRMFNVHRQDYVIIDMYTNVITDNLIFASIFRQLDDKDIPNELPVKSGRDIMRLREALQRVERERPIDETNQVQSNSNSNSNPDYYNSRILVLYDTDKMVCKMMWPPTNFKRLSGIDVSQADGHVLTESVSCSAADEMALFLNDVRSVQQLDDQVSKRFCTIHFFTSREGGLQALESVLDVQGDVTFLISEVRSDKAPRYYEGGSSSEPRRMVPLNTKIGPPAQLRRTPPPQVVQPIPIVASPPQTLSSPSPLSVLSLPPSSNLKMSAFTKVCETCGKSRSPEWRKGPSGEKTLCNACGLRYSRSLKKKEGQQSSSNK